MGKSPCFQFTGEHIARSIIGSDLLQFFIVFQEERKVLVGDIDVTVTAFLPVLLHSVSATRKRVFVNLVLDLGDVFKSRLERA